ncbi:MAG: cyclic nucleotide-binding domain-containing protein [Gammaproteobacteria bacterium]|nr:cyclic nucleotide-binding domain-containing protein [Gammaproteobacteria bacterium]
MSKSGKSIVLFDVLDDATREEVLNSCQCHQYKKGDQIVRQWDDNHHLYFIDQGSMRVTLYSSKGKEVSFVDLHEGDNFGELSAIDGEPRSANVIALTDSVVRTMPSDDFMGLLEEYPQLNRAFLRQLTAMIRRLCDRIFEYSTLGVNHRIHAELLRLAKQDLDLDGVARIRNMPTHAQFGSRLSCTRESVSRELKHLEKNGIIKRHSGKFVVENLSLLEDLVDIHEN